MPPSPSIWAVHVADGVLTWPWLAAGWLLAALLTGVAARRVREEEIPRIALLTAAFFVASSIHVRLGPTSVHLLLNGLVGVVLGRRAPLAIGVGITLQALLIAHGGLTAIGVNATVQALPALAAAGLFGLLRGWTASEARGARLAVVGVGALVWAACLVAGVAALIANPWRDLVRLSADAGLVVSLGRLDEVWRMATGPLALGFLVLFPTISMVLAARRRFAAEFPAGAVVGLVGVLGTLLLAGAVLVLDGAERWGEFVALVFVVHLPLALVEAGIVGCTVGFLARVQPDLIGAVAGDPPGPPAAAAAVALGPSIPPVLAVAALLTLGPEAWAHRLKADSTVDARARQVTVESYYETGEAPRQARAKVLRGDESVLAEGALDERGRFLFSYARAEPLRIEITAPGGHRAVVRLSGGELGATGDPVEPAPQAAANPDDGRRGRDLVVGLSIVLAAAAFLLSWRNARRLRALEAFRG